MAYLYPHTAVLAAAIVTERTLLTGKSQGLRLPISKRGSFWNGQNQISPAAGDSPAFLLTCSGPATLLCGCAHELLHAVSEVRKGNQCRKMYSQTSKHCRFPPLTRSCAHQKKKKKANSTSSFQKTNHLLYYRLLGEMKKCTQQKGYSINGSWEVSGRGRRETGVR